jgi:ribonuclease R
MLIRGIVRGTRQGFAFLSPEDGGEDIFIAGENLQGAIHGDRVEASLFRRSPHDFRSEASVERILERTRPILTGNVVRMARTLFVVPDTPVLPARIRLRGVTDAVPAGAKVLFRIEESKGGAPLVATFKEVLGDGEDPALDALVVATNHQLPGRFPDDAIDEAVTASRRVDTEDLAARISYKDRLVLTIDPETAKDFDDAVSLQRDAAGFHLQVHIADVSWYVTEDGALDREAARRGNSVYFPGSVIPMLPEVLSSNTASLVPGEPRRVMTVEVDLDPDGRPRDVRIREGLIESGARLHYEQAQEMLLADSGDGEIRSSLRLMAELAGLLRRRRFAHGGFDLDVPETEIRLDPHGIPVSITRHRTLDTHRLVEEFMLLANQAVGRFVVARGMPLIFRVHEEPTVSALEKFAEVALTLVPSAGPRDVETIRALRRFLAGLPAGSMTRILHSFFLRSLKQAVYSPIDLGHFGLGIEAYCHFTSPIRRYPDLFNHRIVRWLIRNPEEAPSSRETVSRRWHDRARREALHSSGTERAAEAAEREITRIKILRWAEKRLGECHWGVVVGLTPSGLFVELEEFPVDGFVARATLRPGTRIDQERLAFVHGRSKWELRLGERVEVQIVRVDLRERLLDFHLVARAGAGMQGGKRGSGKAPPPVSRRAAERGRERQARIKPKGRRAERKRGESQSRKTRTPRHRSGGKR